MISIRSPPVRLAVWKTSEKFRILSIWLRADRSASAFSIGMLTSSCEMIRLNSLTINESEGYIFKFPMVFQMGYIKLIGDKQ